MKKYLYSKNVKMTYHMRGKITECWLAETEGIFGNLEGLIIWRWLSFFAVYSNDLLIAI